MNSDLLVLIRGGTYRLERPLVFGPEDSGTERHAITYAARPGEKVVLSGGRKIAGWRRGQGPIWTVDLPAVKAGQWYFRQLFVNDRRAVRARSPNGPQWWKLQPRNNSEADDATIVLGVDHRIAAWKNISDVEAVWINNNDGSRKRLGGVNEAENTFTLPPPHMWPHGMPGEYNISFPKGAYACYFENALEMLDEPGEWYLDRHTGTLSYWPREGEDLTRAEVVAPLVQDTLLSLAGTSERPVRNLRLKDIHVTHVDRPLPPYGFAAQFGCLEIIEQSKPDPSKKFRFIPAAVSFRHARQCQYLDGGIAHVGGLGLSLQNGCADIVIEGNDIGDLGGGGITAGGIRNRDTWKWADPMTPDEHQRYRIANNHVHDCGLDYFGSIGIFITLTQEAVVAHNLIHDVAYSGIVLSGNETPGTPFAKNNMVEYNDIHHVMKTAVDGAGIYVSFPQADRGAVIRGNWIRDLRSDPPNTPGSGGGIYLDGVRPELGCRGYRFEKNVVYRTARPLIFCQCSAAGNTWQDNIFADDPPPKSRIDQIAREAGLQAPYRQKLTHKP